MLRVHTVWYKHNCRHGLGACQPQISNGFLNRSHNANVTYLARTEDAMAPSLLALEKIVVSDDRRGWYLRCQIQSSSERRRLSVYKSTT